MLYPRLSLVLHLRTPAAQRFLRRALWQLFRMPKNRVRGVLLLDIRPATWSLCNVIQPLYGVLRATTSRSPMERTSTDGNAAHRGSLTTWSDFLRVT